MIALPHLRALLGAALCCAPLIAAGAAEATEDFGFAPPAESCASPVASDLMLLAAADTAPARAGGILRNTRAAALGGDILSSSDQLTTNANGQTELTGNVDVHLGEREIQADKLIYDRNNNSLNVSGQVRFHDPTVLIQGDTGRYGDDGALFNHAQFEFLQQPGHGSADQIAMSPNEVITLRHVTYSSCPQQRATWQIRARELRLDTAAGQGVGRGAIVDVEGIPILYVPWISFPLSDARKSGFLFPEIGTSSRSGVMLATPWYWNIAANQDATFTPVVYSYRGIDLGAQYRFLSASNRGSIDLSYLPNDRLYGRELRDGGKVDPGSDRNYVRLLDRLELAGNTRVDTSIESVSDSEYFEDFSQGSQTTSTPFLARSVAVGHRDDVWNLHGQVLDYQSLDTTLAQAERPYIQLPRLTAAGRWSPARWPLLVTGIDTELTNFTRSVTGSCACGVGGCPACSALPCATPSRTPDTAPWPCVSGWRLDAQPRIGLDLSAPGYFFRPSVSWDLTQYSLRDAGAPDSSPQRSLPIVDIDSGLKFERLSGSQDQRTMTLEPRMMYVYIPYRDQNALPLFDTSTPDLNAIELFRPNRFVGLDRIGDANQLTVGVTTQLFENATGVRYLSATLGQSVFLTEPRVTLPELTAISGQVAPPRDTSSLIAEVTLTAYRHWNLQMDLASNSAVSKVQQAEILVQYLASSKQVVNVGYLYRDGVVQQVDGSAAWPVSSRWDIYARTVYSLLDRAPIENFAGFQYRGSCWSIRAVAQSSISTRTGERDTGVSLQLELTGLSNVGSGIGTGSGVSTFLEQSIRGYSASANKP
ncbi:MAG TPA: LPS assembly protein LptD [Steroidobacteraceae bacterium]|jgi:LPS-assembly protein